MNSIPCSNTGHGLGIAIEIIARQTGTNAEDWNSIKVVEVFDPGYIYQIMYANTMDIQDSSYKVTIANGGEGLDLLLDDYWFGPIPQAKQ